MNAADAYRAHHEFVAWSDVLNKILSAYPQIQSEQGDELWEWAQRFNHLLMFLAQFMAFEGFVNSCLRDKSFSPQEIACMGQDMAQKVGHLAPRTASDPPWRDELIPQLQGELQLRNAWMHGCGDDSLIKKTQLKRQRIPQSVLDHDPVANRDWITGPVWSETATLLGQLVDQIASELGVLATP
jgi:hypothetical protein